VSAQESGVVTPPGINPPTLHPSSSSRCIDFVDTERNPHPLQIISRRWHQTGAYSGVAGGRTFVNIPFTNQGVSDYRATIAKPSDVAVITEVQHRTNPSLPEVLVPNFLYELRDIPGMLHLKGLAHSSTETRITRRNKSSDSAVAYNFGWAPLISDLLKLATFTYQVDERLQELEALHSSGLRRKRTVFDTTVFGTQASVAFNTSFGVTIGGSVAWKQRERKWGSVRWIPNAPFKGTKGDLATLARRIVHGWDFTPGAIASTLWESLPWSWFADYFGNVGDYLSSQRNIANASAEFGCVMLETSVVQTQKITSVNLPTITTRAGHFEFGEKYRFLSSAGLSSTLPFLSARQLVTLSSIANSLRK
jgi:hypothetical protein